MSNVVSLQSELVIIRNGIPHWRNPLTLSEDEFFAEYRALKEEMRRREKAETVH